ncbi:MAG: DUF2459 domain-containing protein [Planctomycetota bacterium]|nr:MAG: DUF2459 domain-containing protein [Planctomycetota bacterium]
MATRILRLLRVAALAITAPFALWGLASLVLGGIPTGAATPPSDDTVTIVLESNGAHVSFWFPVAHPLYDWRGELSIEDTLAGEWMDELSPDSWVGIGWGDRRFFLEVLLWSDVTAEVALSALFGGGASALHVEHSVRPLPWGATREVVLSREQYVALVAYVRASFRRDEQGRPKRIGAARYGSYDAFYEAVGSYSPLMTCNEWVSRGLRAVGAPAGAWTPFAYQVLGHAGKAPE